MLKLLNGFVSCNNSFQVDLSLVLVRLREKMVDELKRGENSWTDTTDQSNRVFDIDNTVSLMSESVIITDGAEPLHPQQPPSLDPSPSSDGQLGVSERAFSAAGAAFLSAVLVNPLDVVKVSMLNTSNFPTILFTIYLSFDFHLVVSTSFLLLYLNNITCIHKVMS